MSQTSLFLVKVLRKFKEDGKLDTDHFPNLEAILRLATSWGDGVDGAKYPIVLRGIAKRLFKDKSPEKVAQEKAAVEEWISSLDKEGQEMMRKSAEEEEEEEGGNLGSWFDEKEANEDLNHSNFKITTVWRKYTTYLREVEIVPMRGPLEWDLTEWSEQDKAPFLFKNM